MNNHTAAGKAITAAALFGLSAPCSKLLLQHIPSALLAALLYLGAGFGMLGVRAAERTLGKKEREESLGKEDLKYVIGMIALDIAAPICMMMGLRYENPAAVSLLNNFEIAATALIALALFHEAVGRRMWGAIILITISSILLSTEDLSGFSFSAGSAFVLMACVCWGLENNCTRMLSLKDPMQIVIVKGLGSGTGALLIALIAGEVFGKARLNVYLAAALLLGFIAYGLSIWFYVAAQRELGAARTSAYYSISPFIGVTLSLIIFSDKLPASFWMAAAFMAAGTYLTVKEEHCHPHRHEAAAHSHRHNHHDGHHFHTHSEGDVEHSHYHIHAVIEHEHTHQPDMHHRHSHVG